MKDVTEYVITNRYADRVLAGPFAVLDYAINEVAKFSKTSGYPTTYAVRERRGLGASRIRAFALAGRTMWAVPCRACAQRVAHAAQPELVDCHVCLETRVVPEHPW